MRATATVTCRRFPVGAPATVTADHAVVPTKAVEMLSATKLWPDGDCGSQVNRIGACSRIERLHVRPPFDEEMKYGVIRQPLDRQRSLEIV